MSPRKTFITSVLLASNSLTVNGAITLHSNGTWIANTDFYLNEIPDLPNPASTELSNPNGQYPEWSYGYRDAVNSTDLTLFAPADHNNNIAGNPAFQGWQFGFLTTATNASASVSGGLEPGDLLIHPMAAASLTTYNVIRWTAPSMGTYDIDTSWFAASAVVGPVNDGIDSHIVLNGVSIFDSIVAPGETIMDTRSVNLQAGDYIDFIIGPGVSGSANDDSTIFNATIVAVPEISTTWMIAASAPFLLLRRRTKGA